MCIALTLMKIMAGIIGEALKPKVSERPQGYIAAVSGLRECLLGALRGQEKQ